MAACHNITVLWLSVLALAASTAYAGTECLNALDRQNYYRAKHSTSPLAWDNGLASLALANAQQQVKNSCALQGGSGGNSWMCGGSACGDCSTAVDQWYAGLQYFNFNAPRLYSDNKGNFWQWGTGTQIIWAGAKRVGCAMLRGTNCEVVNCMYDTGNVITDQQFKANVRPLSTSTPSPKPSPPVSHPRSPTPSPKPSPAPVGDYGKDSFDFCPLWAQSGWCKPGWTYNNNGVTKLVTEWCAASCHTPVPPQQPQTGGQYPLPVSPSELPQCRLWASKGMCVPNDIPNWNGWVFMFTDQSGSLQNIKDWCPLSCPYIPVGYDSKRLPGDFGRDGYLVGISVIA